jgi:uncharacterized protein involved in outer membrane biogenesis
VKRAIWTIIIVVLVLVIITLIIIGVYLGQIVKKAVETLGPKMTQTSVTVESVNLSLLTGSAKIKSLEVGDPPGYKTPDAISVGTVAVGIDPMSVFSQKVVIHSIRIESPEINFEGGLTGNNLSQLLDNVKASGGQSNAAPSTNAPAATTQPEASSSKKMEVDDLLITGAKAQVILTSPVQRQVNVTLPDIHLTDLGKDDAGITAQDLTERILDAITTATLETAAKEAVNLDQNATTLKQAGQQIKQQGAGALTNLIQFGK